MLVKDKVFILKKIKYGESDLVLQCLNPKGAKISLFARGALRSKKRFGGGVLEPTHYVHVLYQERRDVHRENPLHTLKEATLIESFDGLRTDYQRLQAGLYFVQAVAEVSREGEVNAPELFNLLGHALRAAESTPSLEKLRVHFEVKLLAYQGILEQGIEEQALVRTPITEHQNLQLADRQWNVVGTRAKKALTEYLGT